MKILRILLNTLKLCIRLLLELPSLIANRQRGVRAFRKQLLKMDLDADIVRELSASYRELGKFSNWIPKTIKK